MSDLHVAIVTPSQRHAAEVRKRLASAQPKVVPITESAPAQVSEIKPASASDVLSLDDEIEQLAKQLDLLYAKREARLREQLLKRPTSRRIQIMVCRHFGLELADLHADRRAIEIVFPRQIAMYLMTKICFLSLPAIGRLFGGKDHTTVMHARDKIEAMRAADPEFALVLEKITIEATT